MFLKLKQRIERLPVAAKVTLWYALLVSVLFSLILAFILNFTHHMAIAREKLRVQKRVSIMASHPETYHTFEDNTSLLLFDRKGKLLQGNYPDDFPTDLPFNSADVQHIETTAHNYFYYDMHIIDRSSHGQWIRGIISFDHILATSHSLINGLLFALPLFLLLTTLGGYRIIKHAFRPVESISRTVRSIGNERDLSRRIAIGSGGDEIHQMAATFNDMLAKIEDSVNREKRFSSDVSHELRTPLSVIMSESEYGKEFCETLEEATASFTTIFQQAQHMNQLINQLLELARMENPSNFSRGRIDFSALLNDLAQEYQTTAVMRHIQFRLKIQQDFHLHGNAILLRRAVANLLDNAFKFTQDTITLQLVARQGHALLSITDNGIGMSADELHQSFDRLYQADNARSTDRSGAGLGLSLVKLIAHFHQGHCWAESTPGKGSTFYLEL